MITHPRTRAYHGSSSINWPVGELCVQSSPYSRDNDIDRINHLFSASSHRPITTTSGSQKSSHMSLPKTNNAPTLDEFIYIHLYFIISWIHHLLPGIDHQSCPVTGISRGCSGECNYSVSICGGRLFLFVLNWICMRETTKGRSLAVAFRQWPTVTHV